MPDEASDLEEQEKAADDSDDAAADDGSPPSDEGNDPDPDAVAKTEAEEEEDEEEEGGGDEAVATEEEDDEDDDLPDLDFPDDDEDLPSLESDGSEEDSPLDKVDSEPTDEGSGEEGSLSEKAAQIEEDMLREANKGSEEEEFSDMDDTSEIAVPGRKDPNRVIERKYENGVLCSLCGGSNERTATTCEWCEADLESGIHPPKFRIPTEQRGFDVRIPILAGILLVVALLGYLAWGFYQSFRLDSLVADGSIALAENQYEEARDQFQAALDIAPKTVPALNGLAEALLELGKADEAAERARRSLELQESDNADADYVLGRALVEQEKYKQAIPHLENALAALSPIPAALYYALGLALKETGETEQAIENLHRATKAYPEAHAPLGELLLDEGSLSEAARVLEQALNHEPTAETWFLLGRARRELEKWSEGIDAFRASLKMEDSSETRFELGRTLLDAGKSKEAYEALSRVRKESPETGGAGLLFALGKAAYQTDKIDEARDLLEDAAREDRKNAQIPYFLGKTYEDSDAREARSHFEDAVERDPGFTEAYVALAETLLKEEREKQALEVVKKALEGGKATPTPRLYLLRGRAQEAIGEDDLALESYKQATIQDHRFVPAYTAQAKLFRKLGQPDDAADAYRTIGQLQRKPDETNLEIARMYRDYRNWSKVVNICEQILKKGEDAVDEKIYREAEALADQARTQQALEDE